MSEHIEIIRRDGVLAIRMNRPDKKNALTAAMYGSDGGGAALRRHAMASVGAVLILGLPGAFSGRQ